MVECNLLNWTLVRLKYGGSKLIDILGSLCIGNVINSVTTLSKVVVVVEQWSFLKQMKAPDKGTLLILIETNDAIANPMPQHK